MRFTNMISRLLAVFGMVLLLSVSGSASTITLASSTTCDTSATSNALNLNDLGNGSGTLNSSSIWYKVVLNSAGYLDMNITSSNKTVTATFYTDCSNHAAGLSTSTTTSAEAGHSLSAGTYYLKVSTSTGGSTNFTVNLGLQQDYTADNPRDYTIAYQTNVIGDMRIIGNSILCAQDTDVKCTTPDPTKNNNNIYTLYYKLTSDAGNSAIQNSTSYTLSLPHGVAKSDILWAKLYWQGGIQGTPTTANITNAQKVLFKAPGDPGYNTINADLTSNRFNWMNNTTVSDAWYYQGLHDITSILQRDGNGTYQVANIEATAGAGYTPGDYGGWAIVIVYKQAGSTLKNITIYDGFNAVNSGNPVTKVLSGFVTPSSNPIDSKFMIFASEGDVKYTGDNISLTETSSTGTPYYLKNDGTVSTTSKDSNPMTSKITMISPDTRTPQYDNAIGIDIGTWNVGTGAGANQIIQPDQTSTTIKLDTSNDVYNPGVFAFSTQIYAPYIDIVKTPSTSGTLTPGTQINYTAKFTNTGLEKAKDVVLYDNFTTNLLSTTSGNPTSPAVYLSDVLDRNATKIKQSIRLSDTNVTTGSHCALGLSDISGCSSYDANCSVDFTGDPNTTATKVWCSVPLIVVNANYTMTFSTNISQTPQTQNQSVAINNTMYADYQNNLTGTSQPTSASNIANAGTYLYSAGSNSPYNIVNSYYFNSSVPKNSYYNLPTQIASRADNFNIITTDGLPVGETVGVQLVDANSGGGVCGNMTPISSRIWVPLNNVNNKTFTAADIIANDINIDPSAATKFYQYAGQNIKFRITHATGTDGTHIVFIPANDGVTYHLLNFPDYKGNCYNGIPVPTYNNDGTVKGSTNQVPVACADNGTSNSNSGMPQREVNACLECIAGLAESYECSDDSFAIRPETFKVTISDQNQVTPASSTGLGNNLSILNLNIAAGYNYKTDVNATDYNNVLGVAGYNGTPTFTANWAPLTSVTCNDTSNKTTGVANFVNGSSEQNASVSQVGHYILNLTDSSWTAIDQNAHAGGGHYSANADCISGSNALVNIGSGNNGCNISSNHISFANTSVVYHDINATIFPYKFDLSTIVVSTKPTLNTTFDNNTSVYMSDVNSSNPASETMSVHFNGNIKAQGYNGINMTNFVNGCFAKPVNINISKTPASITAADYKYRFHDYNSTNAESNTSAGIINNSTDVIPLNSNFVQDMNGTINSALNLNFNRLSTTPINPQSVVFNTYTVSCQNPSTNCQFQADLSSVKQTEGSLVLNKTVKHYYGRTHAPRYRYTGNNGNAPIYYETYCDASGDKTLLPTGYKGSSDSVGWYLNPLHNTSSDGNIIALSEKGASKVTNTASLSSLNGISTATLRYWYNGSNENNNIYPYKTTMQVTPSSWLIYNTYNANATTNDFEVEFYNSAVNWTGIRNTNTTTDSNATTTTNKRILW